MPVMNKYSRSVMNAGAHFLQILPRLGQMARGMDFGVVALRAWALALPLLLQASQRKPS